MKITRDFTATTYIVYKKKILLQMHKKLGFLVPVGGHIEKDEIPEKAALREIKEETGLDVKLYNQKNKFKFKDSKQLILPICILLEKINKSHRHIDLIYYARAETFKLNPSKGETTDLKWFSKEELEKTPMMENIRELALNALENYEK